MKQQDPTRIISLGFTAGLVMTTMIGAGLLYFGKTGGDETLTLAGYLVLGLAAFDWAVWEIFLKERVLRRRNGQNPDGQA